MNLKRSSVYLAAHRLALASIRSALFLLSGGLGKDVIAVLMYHSIEADFPWAVPADTFREQVFYLKSHFRVVPFDQIKAESQRPNGRGRAVSLTFDDGRLDNYDHALPVLEEAGVKGTFFVTTGTIGGAFTTGRYRIPMMNERQLREMVSLGHEIAAHTVTHPALTRIPRDAAYAEMQNSKRQLEDLLGIAVRTIAYPYGDHNREVRDAAAEIGFTCGGIVKNALVRPDSDWLQVPRVGIDHTLGSGLHFKAKVSGAMEVYERIRTAPADSHGDLLVDRDSYGVKG